MMETTGDRIKKYREGLGLTQEELAAKIKTSPQNIYKYEKGIIHNIPTMRIQALSEVFGITPSQLVGWGEDPSASPKRPAQIKNLSEIEGLSDTEKAIIAVYRSKSPEFRKSLLGILEIKVGYNGEMDRPRPNTTLRLASTLPPYKFRNDNKNNK